MLIFFDIDGTLIDEETHELPESAAKAILQARQAGHICIINTGRSKKLVDIEGDRLNGFDGMLMGCGTQIIYRGRELLHKTFTVEEANDIIAGLKKYHIDAVLEGAIDNFCQHDEDFFTEKFKNFIHEFDRFHYKFYEFAPGNFDKFYCYTPDKEAITGFMEEFADRLEMVDRTKGFYEIMPKGFSKASAIVMMAQRLAISMDETVAIGDSNNDIPMIECAHIGIAMGNAGDDVKSIADYVTSDIREDGIANALRWLGAIK